MKTKILIVDPYNIFRSGLKLIIESYSGFKVIGEVLNPNELFSFLKTQRPDVLLMNLALPQKHVFAIFKKLSKEYPEIPFVILTAGAAESVILECINNGAHGMLWKESSPKQLITAISTVAAGERFIDIPESRITSKIIKHAYVEHHETHDFASLSDREIEVLKLFAEGLTYKEIGNKLYISPRTVETHKNNILIKLELQTVTDIVKYAIKHELIEL